MRRIALTAVLLGSLVWAASAQAAFPGANGKIAFVDDTSGPPAIYTINRDGSGLAGPLTSNANGDLAPAWSADGMRIAFTRVTDGNGSTSQIWAMNADGSGQAQLTTSPSGNADCDPYFLPDGRVVFVRAASFCVDGGTLYIRALDGTVSPLPAPPNGQDDFQPTSSPDGQTIAFSRGSGGGCIGKIFTVPVGGGGPTQLTNFDTESCDESPNYSPDGGTIAFDRCGSGEGCDGAKNLYTVPAGGGGVSPLTMSSFTEPDNCTPAWAPDGTQLTFAQISDSFSCRFQNAANRISFATPAGGIVVTATAGYLPDWQPVAVPTTGAGAGGAGASHGPSAKCFGHQVTIFGTNGNDSIAGTRGNDVIHGFRGRDIIEGHGGDDILCGGRGHDRLYGQQGDDVLIGGKQSDYLNGGPGHNRLFGGTPKGPDQNFKNTCVAGPNDKLTNCQNVN